MIEKIEIKDKTVLIVDDVPGNIDILTDILKAHYSVKAAISGELALQIAEKFCPDIILLDVVMPDMDGYEVCSRLKANPETAEIPVIFVTSQNDVQEEARGFDAGAVDYITKPVSAATVLRRVSTHLSLIRTERLDSLARSAVLMLGEAGHYRDTDTGQHIWRMASYSRAIAEKSGWGEQRAVMIELAAPMHDTGKIGIPDSILQAPRKLEPDEWKIMKQHSQIGYEILSKSNNSVFIMAAEIALNHHEKWDGSGYPGGIAGTDIPEAARIVAIADVFDALTVKRPYKERWPVEKAMDSIESAAGTHFDPELIEHFTAIKDTIISIKNSMEDKL